MTLLVPIRNIFFLPIISAMRPNIKTNIALAVRKAIGIQHNNTAFKDNASAIDGIATLTADNMRGVVNAFNRIMISVMRCMEFSRIEAFMYVRVIYDTVHFN